MISLASGGTQPLQLYCSEDWKHLAGPGWLNVIPAVSGYLHWQATVVNADRLAGRVVPKLDQHSVEDLRALVKATLKVLVPQQKSTAPFSKPESQPVLMAVCASQSLAGSMAVGTAGLSAAVSSATWWGARVAGEAVLCNRFVKCSIWTYDECMAHLRCILWYTNGPTYDMLRLHVEAPLLMAQSWRAACNDMRVCEPDVSKLRSAQEPSVPAIVRSVEPDVPHPAATPQARAHARASASQPAAAAPASTSKPAQHAGDPLLRAAYTARTLTRVQLEQVWPVATAAVSHLSMLREAAEDSDCTYLPDEDAGKWCMMPDVSERLHSITYPKDGKVTLCAEKVQVTALFNAMVERGTLTQLLSMSARKVRV